MSQSASLLLALFAALCFGLAPLMGKLGLQRVDPLTALALRSFTVSGCVLIILAATGGFQGFRQVTPRAAGFLVLEGLLAALVGHYAYLYALKYAEASRIVPVVFAAVPAVAFIGGMLILNEKASPQKVIGLILVTAGILIFRLPPKQRAPAPSPAATEPAASDSGAQR